MREEEKFREEGFEMETESFFWEGCKLIQCIRMTLRQE